MSIVEIEAAISRLPASEVSELKAWLERYYSDLFDGGNGTDLEAGLFDSLISEAYSSGVPAPLTKGDIDEARRIVKERIAARSLAK